MKKSTIKTILIALFCLIICIFSYYKFINKESDAIKFKKEYEEYNSKKINGVNYNKIKINSNNPIKYSNYDEVIDIIKNKTGIIYLGSPECPWCRTAIPILIEVANDYDIDVIYYINLLKDRDSYVVENNKLVYELDNNGKEKKGVKGYFELMKVLDKYLSDYIISFEGKEYNTKEKRIYAPTVLFIKNGKIIGIHVSTIESQSSGFDKLSREEKKELYTIYENYIIDMQSESCKVGEKC